MWGYVKNALYTGGRIIKKVVILGFSLVTIVFLLLTSFTQVVGYQTVHSSQQSIIKERLNRKELLFQIICDIANNKEIQRIILKSQMSKGIFPTTDIPVITKNQLRQMYFIGLILTKVIGKSRIQTMVQQYHFGNQLIQKEIQDAIEKDKKSQVELSRLKDLECDCNNTVGGSFTNPVLCAIVITVWLGFFVISILTIPILLKFVDFIENSRLTLLKMIVGTLIISLYFAWDFTGLLIGLLMEIFCTEY